MRREKQRDFAGFFGGALLDYSSNGDSGKLRRRLVMGRRNYPDFVFPLIAFGRTIKRR